MLRICPIKIIFFCLGTIIGSYLGSLIEEKISLNNNTLICIISNRDEKKLKKVLSYNKLYLNKNNYLLLINLKRRKKNKIIEIIKKIDKNSIIITLNSENIV